MISGTRSYTVSRLSDEENERALLDFWNDNHRRPLDEKYRWWYRGNPAGKATVLLVKDSDRNLIGCLAVFPRRISISGVDLRAGLAGDFLVHEKHRVLVPAIKLAKELVSLVREGEFDLIYGFPNKSAEPVMQRAGFNLLAPMRKLVKIVRLSGFLKKYRLYQYLGRPLSPIVDAVVRLFAFETWYHLKESFICEEMKGFDKRFDELWKKSRSRFYAFGERAAEVLEWRYPNRDNAGHRIFAISDSGRGKLGGYIVYRPGERSVTISDFILPVGKKASRVFMTQFLRHVAEKAIQSVSVNVLGSRQIRDAFKCFGFVRRKSNSYVYYYCSEQVLDRFPDLANAENWLFSGFDNDSFGM